MFRSTIPALLTAALFAVPALAQERIAAKPIKMPGTAPNVDLAAKPTKAPGGAGNADLAAKPLAQDVAATTERAYSAAPAKSDDADMPANVDGAAKPAFSPAIERTHSAAPSKSDDADLPAQPAQTDADLPQGKGNAGSFVGLAYLELTASKDGMLTAFVHGAEAGFTGIVLLSSSSDQMHYLTGLPPLLVDFAVMGVGTTKSQDLWLSVPASQQLADIKVYGQALTIDSTGLSVSGIVMLGAQ
jgi:hypothetical protein